MRSLMKIGISAIFISAMALCFSMPIKADVNSSLRTRGFQMSYEKKGIRTVGMAPEKINGKNVVKTGFIYGVKESNGFVNNISDEDMVANSTNKYVVKLESTAQGYNDHLKENQYDTNKYFVRTITFAYGSKAEFESVYLARAYAVLEDGTYVYEENSKEFSILSVAELVYAKMLMSSQEAHDYLYNVIILPSNPSFPFADYNWSGGTAPAGE